MLYNKFIPFLLYLTVTSSNNSPPFKAHKSVKDAEHKNRDKITLLDLKTTTLNGPFDRRLLLTLGYTVTPNTSYSHTQKYGNGSVSIDRDTSDLVRKCAK